MSHHPLDPLLTVSLRGTSRSPLPPPDNSPLGQHLQRVEGDSAESTLLARAAVASLAWQAARRPPTLPQPPARYGGFVQTGAVLPEALSTLIPELSPFPLVIGELLQHLAERHWPLSALDATPILNTHYRTPPPLWPRLDEYARWLVPQRPAWEAFLPGQQEEKRHWIELHATDPDAMLAEVQRSWAKRKADARVDILEAMAPTLGLRDQAFLKEAAQDRVERVRSLATILLTHLPGPQRDEVRGQLRSAFTRTRQGRFAVADLPAPAFLLGNRRPFPYAGVHAMLATQSLADLADLLGTDIPTLAAPLGSKDQCDLRPTLSEMAGRYGGTPSDVQAVARKYAQGVSGWPRQRQLQHLWALTGRMLEEQQLHDMDSVFLVELLDALPALPPSPAWNWPERFTRLTHHLFSLLDDVPSFEWTYMHLFPALASQYDLTSPPPRPYHPERLPAPEGLPDKEFRVHEAREEKRQQISAVSEAFFNVLSLRERMHAALRSTDPRPQPPEGATHVQD